jgi:hypothetical protein
MVTKWTKFKETNLYDNLLLISSIALMLIGLGLLMFGAIYKH